MPIMQIGSLHLLVNRKAIKNLHISVLPPDGKVRVSAPEHMTETAIRRRLLHAFAGSENSSRISPDSLVNQRGKWSAESATIFGAEDIAYL